MKYMMLIYNNADTLAAMPEAERSALMDEVGAYMAKVTASGELVGGAALEPPGRAKTIMLRAGAPSTTDGPFLESKEQFAGYVTFDVASEERAIELVSTWPDAVRGTAVLELRRVLDGPEA